MRRRRQAWTDEVLRVYGCEDCGLWHLTHQPMTAAQVRALEDLFRLEMRHFRTTHARLQELIRPYARCYAMYGKRPNDIDTDFTQQLDLLEQAFQCWLACHQRQYVLALAYAPHARAARRIDRDAHVVLEESLKGYQVDRASALVLYQRYRAEVDRVMNKDIPLPAFDWRAYLR